MMNKILPKKVYDKSDFLGIKAIDDVLKKGGVVALSPEGNTSNFGFNQPAALGTGRLLKYFNVPIYMMRIDGTLHCDGRLLTAMASLFAEHRL